MPTAESERNKKENSSKRNETTPDWQPVYPAEELQRARRKEEQKTHTKPQRKDGRDIHHRDTEDTKVRRQRFIGLLGGTKGTFEMIVFF
jgi:hypothetical protein